MMEGVLSLSDKQREHLEKIKKRCGTDTLFGAILSRMSSERPKQLTYVTPEQGKKISEETLNPMMAKVLGDLNSPEGHGEK